MDPDQAEEYKNNKVGKGLEMMDQVLKMTEIKAVKRMTSLWKYVVIQSSLTIRVIIAIPEGPL